MTTRSATVRYSYKAAHEDELDLEVDDVIDVLEEAETGWMKGKLRNTGRVGLFPTNFVHFFDKTAGNSDAPKSNNVKNFSDTVASVVCGFLDQVLLSSLCLSGLSLSLVILANVNGDLSPQIPTSRLSVISQSSEDRVNYNVSDATILGRKEANARARVLFTYSPKHDDELPLREVGQIVGIVSKSSEDPGWLVAEVDGRQGLIPDNFVEILKSAGSTSTTNSDTHKMSLPPNVPAKPISKPVTLSSGTSRRATTSSVFAQMHCSLADAFTKPPKQFAARIVKAEESTTDEGQTGDRLSHITTTRPKQPNKRPPSTIFRTKSNEGSPDDGALVAESGKISPTASSTSSISSSYTQQPLLIAPSMKSIKVQQTLSPRNSSNDVGEEFVPRSEYNRLVQQFEDLLTTMNKFRLEMSQKMSILEAKITKHFYLTKFGKALRRDPEFSLCDLKL
ncbi:unnamed protein product [Litomosoides sigmodontis]|uniref:SH3 domain-containing protein n=1 Tax=Litomosoides sigmodontis TaxID=42156 RepID=A0A3P6UP36_LITSI|nr:unnamed protein product [Litomosoides sigmodontis]